MRLDVVAGETPVAARVEVAERQRLVRTPAAISATARVILRVTKFSPRRGDSWLNRIPLQQYIPYASR